MILNLIPFNKPYLTGKEVHYIYQAVNSGKISGNGLFTKKCQSFFEKQYGFGKCLLTTSCTDALEMTALLLNLQAGDEVIMPSYTFVSTANAFALREVKIVFADSRKDHPGIDEKSLENLISSKTKAIVVVHYAGVACDMDMVMDVAERNNLYVVEDAAQAIDATYNGKPLGSIGHLSTFSFHETKNVISGEGGMLAINDPQFEDRAEIIWEKGTNRSAFFRGETDKYNWVDVGSSFLPSDVTAAFLYAQLEHLKSIQKQRIKHWNLYWNRLQDMGEFFELPYIPPFASNNAHMFYLVMKNDLLRSDLIAYLKSKKINAVFHYLSLHTSPYYKGKHDGRNLAQVDRYSDCLVRLPFYYELEEAQINYICDQIIDFCHKQR